MGKLAEIYRRSRRLDLYHRTAGHGEVEAEEDQNMFMASSIMVSGIEVGNIHIETDSNRHWGIEDVDLVGVANDSGNESRI